MNSPAPNDKSYCYLEEQTPFSLETYWGDGGCQGRTGGGAGWGGGGGEAGDGGGGGHVGEAGHWQGLGVDDQQDLQKKTQTVLIFNSFQKFWETSYVQVKQQLNFWVLSIQLRLENGVLQTVVVSAIKCGGIHFSNNVDSPSSVKSVKFEGSPSSSWVFGSYLVNCWPTSRLFS